MHKTYCVLFFFFCFHAMVMGNRGWMWFEHYPWVYSNEDQSWVYLLPKDQEMLAYVVKEKSWEAWGAKIENSHESSWEAGYLNWLENSESYGGVEVLQLIKETKEQEMKTLYLENMGLSDLSPLMYLTELKEVFLMGNPLLLSQVEQLRSVLPEATVDFPIDLDLPALRSNEGASLGNGVRTLRLSSNTPSDFLLQYPETSYSCSFVLRYFFHTDLRFGSETNELISMDGSAFALSSQEVEALTLEVVQLIAGMYYGKGEYDAFISTLGEELP